MQRGRGRGDGSGSSIGVSNFDLYLDMEELSSVPQCCDYDGASCFVKLRKEALGM
jgi:hypothetical protein